MVFYLVGAVFGLLPIAVLVGGAKIAGDAVAAGELSAPMEPAHLIAVGVFGLPVFIAATRALNQIGTPEDTDGMLTTVGHRTFATGLLLTDVLLFVGVTGLPLLAATIAFGVGSGSLLSIPLLFLTALILLILGLEIGYAVGFGVNALFIRVPQIGQYRTPLSMALFGVYFLVVFTDNLNWIGLAFGELLAQTPVAWYADLALLPAVDGASPLYAGVAAVLTVPLVLACNSAVTRLAGLYWYADPVGASADDSESASVLGDAGTESRLSGLLPHSVLGPLFAGAAGSVTRKSWLRARRAPIKLIYVVYPLLFFSGVFISGFEGGGVSALLPVSIALYLAWATGAAFTLNPLGDEGAVLPVTVTTPVSGAAIVRGLVTAGSVIGVPLTMGLVLLTGLLSPLGPVAVGVTTLLSGVLCIGAAMVGAGIGTAFPKYETAQVWQSHEAVVPSLVAFALYSLSVILLWLPGGIGLLLSESFASPGGLSASAVAVLAGGISMAVITVAGWLSVRYAARTFESYTIRNG